MMMWQKLSDLHAMARAIGVSYSLHYAESDDSWYAEVSSAAPSEEWIGRNRASFTIAIDDCIAHLNSIDLARRFLARPF